MQKVISFVKKFKLVVLILLVGVGGFGYIVSQIVPIVTNITKLDADYKTANSNFDDKTRTLESLKEKEAKDTEESKEQMKAFFRPIEQGLDTEAVIANEFAEILVLIRNNSIKARSIKYEYDPQDDNFVKNLPDQYNVAKLDLELIATYRNFERFLKELYKHEHFVDISSMEIIPYEKDKKILLISFQMKLYAQK